jgi:hypothetical protein
MPPLAYTVFYVAEESFWCATLAFALWRGDAVVRAAALAVLVPGLPAWAAWTLPGLHPFAFWFEAATLAGLAITAAARPRPWLICAAAFQLALVASKAARMLDPHILTLAGATANNTWWMLSTAALLWGAVEARRRRATVVPAMSVDPASPTRRSRSEPA